MCFVSCLFMKYLVFLIKPTIISKNRFVLYRSTMFSYKLDLYRRKVKTTVYRRLLKFTLEKFNHLYTYNNFHVWNINIPHFLLINILSSFAAISIVKNAELQYYISFYLPMFNFPIVVQGLSQQRSSIFYSTIFRTISWTLQSWT